MLRFVLLILAFLGPTGGFSADDSLPSLISSTVKSNATLDSSTFLTLQNQLRIIGFLSIISLLPFAVMMMTSFTRITIVFQFLRQALGSSQVPSNQIVIGLSLILTGFVMHPVIQQIQHVAFNPYMKGTFKNLPEVKAGVKSEEAILFEKAWMPLRHFLLTHAREKDLELFLDISHVKLPVDLAESFNSEEERQVRELDAIPWYCLIPSFILSELRTAFMMGFLLFLPFLIIDMVVASVLMSMGMMMLPPIMVSTPFKLLLFIMIDGWRIIVYQLIKGYQ